MDLKILKLFQLKEIDINGRELVNTNIIIKELIYRKNSTLIFSGYKDGIEYVIKATVGLEGYENMKKMKDIGIPMFEFYDDQLKELEGYDTTNENSVRFIVMEKLEPIPTGDILKAYDMLLQLLPVIFLYKDFMAHCDIKPANIMYKNNKFYFIDIDAPCTRKMLYGYERESITTQYAYNTETNLQPTIVNIKTDIIELVLTAYIIAGNIEEDDRPIYIDNMILNCIYLLALNMNDNNVTYNDLLVMLKTIEIGAKGEDHIIELIYDKLSKSATNNQILDYFKALKL